ncbi:MAG TPA: hypothetical protein VGB78_11320 [Thermoplasmata archaeon]
MSSVGSRTCVSCGRALAWDANVCPYCGHDFRQAAAAQPVEHVSTLVKIIVYLVSFFIPIIGIILGVVFYVNANPEYKQVGKMCLILAMVAVLIAIVCFAAGVVGSFWAF